MIAITPDRKKIIESEGHLLVLGGPGSGKTTIALLKAYEDIKSGHLKNGQKILFLSFARATVARVAEQAGKIIQNLSKQPLELNTYHSFIWRILHSHGYLLSADPRTKLLPPPEAAKLLSGIPKSDHLTEKGRLYKEDGLLHFDLFASVAFELLSRSPKLTKIICDRYPCLVLDEFQDTNQDEWNLITLLGNHSRLVSLADPNQRIYEFRGADPKRIGDFINLFSPTIFDFGSENNRSEGKDIAVFGNDLLTGANKGKTYNDVIVSPYGFYKGKKVHFAFKAEVLKAIKRQSRNDNKNWSIAILVPTRRLMLAISDYLSSDLDRLPKIYHDVSLDTEGPALAAVLIARLLESDTSEDSIMRNLLEDFCSYLRGRRGGDQLPKAELKLVMALEQFLSSGKIQGSKRQQIVTSCKNISAKRLEIELNGNSWEDWESLRKIIAESPSELIRNVAYDANYLRLLQKGTTLRGRLNELWRQNKSYAGAANAMRNALLQEHFSSSTKTWRGIHVMTIHKSKGKEFDEVLIYEGSYDPIVYKKSPKKDLSQKRLVLRVAVTRAMQRASIHTPKSDQCILL